MAQGTINGTTSSKYCISKIDWSSVVNDDANHSTVTATLYLKRTNEYPTTGQEWSFEISIDGQKSSVSEVPLTIKNEWIEAMTATATVEHNGDGRKSINISASGGNPDTSVKTITCTGTAVLDTIARASSITSASDVMLGEKCYVKWTPGSETFRYLLEVFLEDKKYSAFIHPNTTDLYTYGLTIPLDAAELFTESRTGNMYVSLTTYTESEEVVGNPSTAEITVTVPASTLPTVSIVSVSPDHSLSEDFSGLYVQGISKVMVVLNAEPQYGAGIKAFDFTVEGKNYAGPIGTSAQISGYGAITIVGHAEDTREYSGYAEENINVIPYTIPKVQNVTVQRCNAAGKYDVSGTYIMISAKRVYSKMEVDGVQKNFCSIKYSVGDEEPETILQANDLSTDEIVTNPIGTFETDTSYSVRVFVTDSIGNTGEAFITVPTERVYQHRDGARRSYTFGGYVEEPNTFAITEDISFLAKGGIGALGSYEGEDFHALINRTGYYYGTKAPASAGCINYLVDKPGILYVTAIKDVKAHLQYCTDDGEKYFQSWTPDGWSAIVQL